MESKLCNVNVAKKKLLSTLVSTIVTEFKDFSIADPRFGVVAFGGSKEFQRPRSITLDGHVFTNEKNVQLYFDHLKDGNSTTDVFTALTIASKIVFKPGAAKIFVLSLCTKCEFNSMKVNILQKHHTRSYKNLFLV